MKKIGLSFLMAIISLHPALAVDVKGRIKNKKGEAIASVKVFWKNTEISTLSDADGKFSLPGIEQNNTLIISALNYNPDTIPVKDLSKHMEITLSNSVQLAEVSIVRKSPGLLKARAAIFQTEKITVAELCKAACCNLSESFETNPSVDVSYSDAATGAKQIRLLGLSGTYVQMLTENIPNFRGISSTYGLGFVPGPWMESIQVSKGTASVINGYEAVAGQINVEYKKPQTSEKVAANMFASNTGRLEANVNASTQLSKELSTGVLLHASNEFMDMDDNKDNFADLPRVKQYNLINRWYYKKGQYVSQLFLHALSENRTGGQIQGAYKIGIDTKRYEFFAKNGYVFDAEKGTSIGFIVSGSLHNQDASYGLKSYNGKQDNLYANLIYQTSFGKEHKLSTGASINYDNYNESSSVIGSSLLRKELVPGLFSEYTLNINDKFFALAGLRYDHHSIYGSFITPRLNLKYNASEHLKFRASAGKGYRSANILAENNFMLASNREIRIVDNIKMEQAWNYGLSTQAFIPIFDKELSLTGEWYYSNFENQVIADMDSETHAVSFANLNGKSYAHSYQLEANMEVFRGFTATIAHRITDARSTIGGILREKPLTNRYKSLFTASYQTPLKKWQFDFTTQLNGGGRLPDPDAQNPAWEKEFKPFTILNAQITKYFRTWSVYMGAENLTNFVQKNPIIDVQNPFGNNFDASMIWGPVHGSKYYIGFRWSIDRE